MPVSINRGTTEQCLEGLRNKESDLTEYPLNSYAGQGTLQLNGEPVDVFQGVNTVPKDRFQVEIGDEAAQYAGLEVPGILPFLGSGKQFSDPYGRASPAPVDVGIPHLLVDDGCLIRWMFNRAGTVHDGYQLWGRLNDTELDDIDENIRPDESVEEGQRESSSFENPSGGITAPEPTDFVEPRAGGLTHEPWLARSVELAESWRLVVPNTSKTLGALIVPPTLTIIGDNFNVILPGSGERAVAIARVMSKPESRSYLEGICPWSSGPTPRPRTKHVNATLWRFEDEIGDELQNRESLREDASGYAALWRLHVLCAVALANDESDGSRLSSRYSEIEPQQGSLDRTPTDLNGLTGSDLVIGTEHGDVEISFSSPLDAAFAAVAAWTGMPRNLTIGELLDVHLPIDEIGSDVDGEDLCEAVSTAFGV